MTNLYLNVHCLSEFDEKPDMLAITPSKGLMSKILDLMAKVSELNIHSIEILSVEGEWISEDNLCCDSVSFSLSELTKEEVFAKIASNDAEFDNLICQMQDHKVKIFKDFIRFYATPKHCETSVQCYTDKVHLSELQDLMNAA